MLSAVLLSSAASILQSRSVESNVPSDWPGTYCPNFSDWQVGDIVLVHGGPDWRGRGIKLAQLFSTKLLIIVGRRISHVGIYVGDGMMIDAPFGGRIGLRSVWYFCQYRHLELRRLDDPALPAGVGAQIALSAIDHIGERYSILALILSKLVPNTVPERRALYCSTFVGLVVADATGVGLDTAEGCRPLYPATLAAHPDLTTILLEWRSL